MTPARHLSSLLDSFSPASSQSPLLTESGEKALDNFLVASSPEASPPRRALAKDIRQGACYQSVDFTGYHFKGFLLLNLDFV